MKRLEIKEYVSSFSRYDLEGNVYTAIKNIQDTIKYCQNLTAGKYDSFEINIGLDDEFEILGRRLENDKEYNARIAMTKKEKERQKKKKEDKQKVEYETYLKLKEKYETKN